MKLLFTTTDKREAAAKTEFLRRHGIAVHLSDSYTRSLAGSAAFRGDQQSVWVVLEEQFPDAKALMEDPNYEVRVALSESELAEIEQNAREAMNTALSSLGGWIMAALLILVTGGLLTYVLLNVYNT